MLHRSLAALVLAGTLLLAQTAMAGSISGILESESEVDFFTFDVNSTVIMQFFTSQTSFDPMLSLFGPSGDIKAFNDDTSELYVPEMSFLDSGFFSILTPGTYVLAISAFDNSPGVSLLDGFFLNPESPAFVDGMYTITQTAFDGSSVGFDALTPIDDPLTAVPLPAGVWLLGAGLAGLVIRRKRA